MIEKLKKIPRHIGILIGGNREWAKERNLVTEHGFLKSFDVLKTAPAWFFERGVKEISFSLFMNQGDKYSREESAYLMKAAKNFFMQNLIEFNQLGYKILFSGETSDLPGDLSDVIQQTSISTKENNNGVINYCFNYDGRKELVEAVKRIVVKKYEVEQVNEALIKKYLYQNELAYPDLIVGTAGLQKLSGFLLWQSEESKFISLNKFWPDFEKTDVELILNKYN